MLLHKEAHERHVFADGEFDVPLNGPLVSCFPLLSSFRALGAHIVTPPSPRNFDDGVTMMDCGRGKGVGERKEEEEMKMKKRE